MGRHFGVLVGSPMGVPAGKKWAWSVSLVSEGVRRAFWVRLDAFLEGLVVIHIPFL